MLVADGPDGNLSLCLEGDTPPYVIGGRIVQHSEIDGIGNNGDNKSHLWNSIHLFRGLLCAGVKPDRWDQLITHGRRGKPPAYHQYLPMDLLRTPWLSSLFQDESTSPFPRNRLLIADEGGLGKTYSTALAIADQWLESRGIVIVMCPPGEVEDKWEEEIGICLSQYHTSIKKDVKAGFFSNHFNQQIPIPDGIYIVSKFSIAETI